MVREWIEKFAAGAEEPAAWIAGLTPVELRARPVPGAWSMQQLAQHMLDSEMMAAGRMQRIIAEDAPLILAYDETRFAERLGYEDDDAELAARAFALVRRRSAALLARQPESAFARHAIHSEAGKLTLLDVLKLYADHVPHHARFAMEKRKALGKASR